MNIKKLDSVSIQNICANQVILDLASSIKELLENSLDAKAKSIEIYLKEFGQESIVVKDNGHGISEENFESIINKGATSKISDFNDLQLIYSYGFRGEALNALNQISDLTLITKTEKDNVGWKLKYNKESKLVLKEEVACETGTNVILEKLYANIPVRYLDLTKNIKSHYMKLISLITEYAIISTSIRISLYNQTKLKSKESILNSGNSDDILERIKRVLGQKEANSLMEFNCEIKEDLKITGFILKNVNSGSVNESAWLKKNITFFYVNKRPINPHKKIMYLFGEFYRQYNNNSKFIAILNFVMDSKAVDYNLSPDKREVCFENEKEIIEILKKRLYESHEINRTLPKTINTQEIDFSHNKNNKSTKKKAEEENNLINMQRNREENNLITKRIKSNHDETILNFQKNTYYANNSDSRVTNHFTINEYRPNLFKNINSEIKEISDTNKTFQIRTFESKKSLPLNLGKDIDDELNSRIEEKMTKFKVTVFEPEKSKNMEIKSSGNLPMKIEIPTYRINTLSDKEINEIEAVKFSEEINDQSQVKNPFEIPVFQIDPIQNDITDNGMENKLRNKNLKVEADNKEEIIEEENDKINDISDPSSLPIKQPNFQKTFQNFDEENDLTTIPNFEKKDFKNLEIIGQFNMGFIITYLPQKRQIFVIDQHASDEKRNYETMIKNYKFENQILFNPIVISDLSDLERNTIKENQDIFLKNGFNIKFTAQEEQFTIKTLPCFKNIQFDLNDFYEILNHLTNNADDSFFRPTKFKTTIAYKACRKAMKVGDELNFTQMKEIVKNMEILQSPWNCPHGRPTMVKTQDLSTILQKIYIKRPERKVF